MLNCYNVHDSFVQKDNYSANANINMRGTLNICQTTTFLNYPHMCKEQMTKETRNYVLNFDYI